MSRLDALTKELCPDGVPFLPLGECVLANLGGGTPSRSRSEYWNGDIPWASVGDVTATTLAMTSTRQSITPVGLESSSSNRVPAGWVVVAVKIAPGAMRVVEREVAINQDLRGLLLTEAVDPYFLTYYFKTLNVVGNGTIVKGITNQALLRIRVPVPPLEVQHEIVRVLDQFAQLEAELEAELEARTRQYDYYLNEMLRFEATVRRLPIGDFAVLVRGNGMPKTDFTAMGTPAIHYGQIYTHFGTWATETKSFVAPATAARLATVEPGDIVITNTSENLEDVGKAVAWLGDATAVTGGHATVIKHDENPKFLAYYFQTQEFHSAKRKHATGTKVIDVSARGLAKIEVPLPARSEQDRLVAILDDFDALVNDLSIGLPAELAARRKQYEYYRDKLLTFKESPA